jgi:hypothetical protein
MPTESSSVPKNVTATCGHVVPFSCKTKTPEIVAAKVAKLTSRACQECRLKIYDERRRREKAESDAQATQTLADNPLREQPLEKGVVLRLNWNGNRWFGELYHRRKREVYFKESHEKLRELAGILIGRFKKSQTEPKKEVSPAVPSSPVSDA